MKLLLSALLVFAVATSFSQDTTVTHISLVKSLAITIKNGYFNLGDIVKIGKGNFLLSPLDSTVTSGVLYKKFWIFGMDTAYYPIFVGDTVHLVSKTIRL